MRTKTHIPWRKSLLTGILLLVGWSMEASVIVQQTEEHFAYSALQETPYTWAFNGQTYREPGYYTDLKISGQDSTIGQLLLAVDYEQVVYTCVGTTVDSVRTPWGTFGFDTCQCLTGCLMQTEDSLCIVDALICIAYTPTIYDTVDVTLPYDTLKEKGYTWFGEKRDTAGVYRDTTQTAEGCDSIGLLILRTTYQDSMYVCGEDTAVFTTPWGEIGLKSDCECMEGALRKTADNEDLVWARLCVTRLGTDTVREDTTLCYGSSIVWHGITVDQTKEYEYDEKYTRLATCDSVIFLLNATVKPEPVSHPTTASVCAGEKYTWTTYHDSIIEAPGTYYDTLWVDHGCYSDVYELELTHLAHSKGDTTAYVCYYDLPYKWHDIEEAKDSDTWVTKNAAGCDSTVYLHLFISPEPKNDDADSVICEGDRIEWHEQIITASGLYKDTARVTMGNGMQCDSIWYTLDVTVLQVLPDSVSSETVCYGSDVEWRGQTITDIKAAMTLKDTIYYTQAHCDSLRFVHTIYVQKGDTTKNNISICEGGQYTWKRDRKPDRIITEEGEYWDTVRYAATACDSMIYYLNLKVDDVNRDSTAKATCEGTPYIWRTRSLTASGIYRDTAKAQTVTECDTIFTLKLTVNSPSTGDTTAYVCYDDLPFIWHGSTAEDGDQWTTTNYVNCDSVVTLHLFVSPEPKSDDVDSAMCQGESITWRGQTITAAGYYYDTVRVTMGNGMQCDSMRYSLQMTIKLPTSGANDTTVCISDLPVLWEDSTWYASGIKTKVLTNAAGCDSVVTLTLTAIQCCPDTIHKDTVVNMCDTLLPYTWQASKPIKIYQDGKYVDTLRNDRGCDSIIYSLDLTTYHCCRPLKATMQVPDVCADQQWMDVVINLSSGNFNAYRVRYTNAEGNKMPFRDTLVVDVAPTQGESAILTLPVPHDEEDRRNYPRPDKYGIQITLFDVCGDSLELEYQNFDVLFPSWLLDQHWDDVIALLNDRYNGGYTFTNVEWMRDGEVLGGENKLYIYLPHQLWTNAEHQHQDYHYQAMLTRADDGKTIMTCPMVPYHIDSTNVLTEPYVAVTPTLVPKENPVVHIQTNTRGTYWLYDPTGKLLQTADYEPCEHDVFDIELHYHVQTMYILVFTPRNETKPLQKKYRVVKLLVE